MYNSAIEVLRSYPSSAKMCYDYGMVWPAGRVEALVVNNGDGWDVWNMHPLRKAWQHVYSLSSCDPEKHVVQSIQSLKRLFDKE